MSLKLCDSDKNYCIQIKKTEYSKTKNSTWNETLSSVTYPFLIFCSLSPHSMITNLHIFLSLSHSFLLVTADGCPTSIDASSQQWRSKNASVHCQKYRIFNGTEKPGIFGIPYWIFWQQYTIKLKCPKKIRMKGNPIHTGWAITLFTSFTSWVVSTVSC